MRRRIAWVGVGAVAFGLLAAWAKDPGSNGVDVVPQLRAAVGNLSAPWALLAFAAGAASRRVVPGAVLGLAATVLALLAFYVVSASVVGLGLGTELQANRYYLEAGLVSGPVFGALGAWWRRSASVRASFVAGLLLAGEPVVLALLGGLELPARIPLLSGWRIDGHTLPVATAVYAAEFAAGAALVAWSRHSVASTAPRRPGAG